MSEMVARLDNWGQPAWIGVMVIGFVIFWPIGLAILGYLIWSGRMGCGRKGMRNRWQQRMAGKWEEKMQEFGMTAKAYQPTGNYAFDEYREETLRRLEEEAEHFKGFLDKLRMAKDKAEFEQFMTERKSSAAQSDNNGSSSSSGPSPEASPA
ncbi:MAG: DUF2852 domain-containing protein [Pseudomonadota bacterium]